MTTRIVYSQSTQTGKMLAQAVNKVLESKVDLGRVKALLDAASNGSDWTAVAAEVGGGITTTQAQDLLTIISTVMDALNATGSTSNVAGKIAELSRLDQG